MTFSELRMTEEQFRSNPDLAQSLAKAMHEPGFAYGVAVLMGKALRRSIQVGADPHVASNAWYQASGVSAFLDALHGLTLPAPINQAKPSEETHIRMGSEWIPKDNLPPELREKKLPEPRQPVPINVTSPSHG